MYRLVIISLVYLSMNGVSGENAVLTSVECYDSSQVTPGDKTYDRGSWGAGKRNLYRWGPNKIKIIDQFIEGYIVDGQHVAAVCHLSTPGIKIGQYWINDAGDNRWPGDCGILGKPTDEYLTFFLRTTRKSHSFKYHLNIHGEVRDWKKHNGQKSSLLCLIVNYLEDNPPCNCCEFNNWPV